jgi:DNA replication initiation complex subunit (GINS family)
LLSRNLPGESPDDKFMRTVNLQLKKLNSMKTPIEEMIASNREMPGEKLSLDFEELKLDFKSIRSHRTGKMIKRAQLVCQSEERRE